MPPHCDSLDGPVVRAARAAIQAGNVDLVLPYVHAEGADEVRDAFSLTAKARALGGDAREVADRWFFETVVRVHRAGEGAPFTGLKPAGLEVGPVIPVAERALDRGSATELADLLAGAVRNQVETRCARAVELASRAGGDVAREREAVEAGLGFQVWAHHLYEQIVGEGHGEAAGHEHG